MESSNLFGRYRTLLPYEIELCDVLGITHKEYLEFVDLTFKYHQDSRKGYELIPDVRCDPVSLILMAVNAGFWTKVAITVAIAAVTYLLRAKRKHSTSVDCIQKAINHLEFELDKIKNEKTNI